MSWMGWGWRLARQPNASHHFLETGVLPQRVHSGIHPDPYQSSGSLTEGFLHGVVGVIGLPKIKINAGDEEVADVSVLFHSESLIERLPGAILFTRPCQGGSCGYDHAAAVTDAT